MIELIKKFLLKEFHIKIKKIFWLSFLIALFITTVVLFLYWPRDLSNGKEPIYGLNFSQKYANDLHLNWKTTYLAIIDELKPERIRISAHWDMIEREQGIYDFTDLDWQIEEADKRNINIILAIGRRTPRWPECHPPRWTEDFTEEKNRPYILNLLTAEINHFKKYDNIVYWQVENEPLLDIFGICPDGDKDLLDEEIALVKSLSDKPILLTDSGELGTWLTMSKRTEILGTSMYRIVWNPIFGFMSYALPPGYYYYKTKINQFFNPNLKNVIVTELQGEAWGGKPLIEMTLEEQYRSMNANKLQSNIEYAKKTGLNEIYIWGAEWWYWVKLQGDDTMWVKMQEILNKDK